MLGQKQGSVGGGFQAAQSFKGMLSNVNLWNRVLPASQIEEMATSCLLDPWNAGNVYKWRDFLQASDTRLLATSTCEPLLAGRLHNTFPGGGLPYERDGDARRIDKECKFRIFGLA